jgi:hypothetical protein
MNAEWGRGAKRRSGWARGCSFGGQSTSQPNGAAQSSSKTTATAAHSPIVTVAMMKVAMLP